MKGVVYEHIIILTLTINSDKAPTKQNIYYCDRILIGYSENVCIASYGFFFNTYIVLGFESTDSTLTHISGRDLKLNERSYSLDQTMTTH